MKTDFMDTLDHILSKHRGRGVWSYLIYFFIFIFMLGYVIVKPLVNLLAINKLKLK